MTEHERKIASHLQTARAILEQAIAELANEDPASAGVVALAVESGASLRITVEFPSVGTPTIAAAVVMPNGDLRDFSRITATPHRRH